MTIVVTGFGPFGSFPNNPSSDIVDLLEKEGIPGCSEKLVIDKMSVAYETVESKVNELWKQHQPKLMIHIGAHPTNRCVKLEQQSFRNGYCRYDVNGCVPDENICASGCDCDILTTSIDCKEIATKVTDNLGYINIRIEQSQDPGRYLCAYSYYLSLTHGADRSLFIHVPAFDSECSLEKVTNIIREVIKEILKTF